MRKSTPKRLPALAALLLAGLALGQAQRKEIEVDVFGAGKVKAIPIAIEGFSGETLALLKFDLFVQGFEFVDKAKAQFTIKNNGSTASSVSFAEVADALISLLAILALCLMSSIFVSISLCNLSISFLLSSILAFSVTTERTNCSN